MRRKLLSEIRQIIKAEMDLNPCSPSPWLFHIHMFPLEDGPCVNESWLYLLWERGKRQRLTFSVLLGFSSFGQYLQNTLSHFVKASFHAMPSHLVSGGNLTQHWSWVTLGRNVTGRIILPFTNCNPLRNVVLEKGCVFLKSKIRFQLWLELSFLNWDKNESFQKL